MVCGSHAAGQTGLTVPFGRGRRRGAVDDIDVIEFELRYSNKDGFVRRSITFLIFAARSIQVALTESYDLLFATTTPLTAGIPGIVARWIRGARFVFEVRDLWPELPREMGVITNPVILLLLDWLEWACYRSAHRLIGLSPGIVSGIIRRGVRPEKVTMIPNGCDLAIFADKSAPWRPPQVQAADLMAVFAGAHGKANGLDAVLDAAAVLKQRRRPDIKIVLVGDGQLKESLMLRASREQLDNVVFHGLVNKTRLAGLMASTDIGLQILANVPAFYYGTSPNKFFDYIAAGLPTLVNYPGWLAELVKDHRCGFAVEPESPPAFADALIYAAEHREELRDMGERALSLAKASFDRKVLGDRFVEWLSLSAVESSG
jgi:glycosyltransferase involved in cell wall biosynthesis